MLSQTIQDIEIIVVNDSGQGVEPLLLQLDAGRGLIASIRGARNLGRGGVRNLGLQIAKGKYIGYLDDDDYYYPNHLERLLNFISTSGRKVVYSDSLNAIQQMQEGRWVTVKTQLIYSRDFDPDLMLIENYIPTLCFLHERECLNRCGLFDEKLKSHEDWDLWIRLSRDFDFYHLKEITSEYTTRIAANADQSTTDVNADFVETQEYIYKKYESFVATRPDIKQRQDETNARLRANYEIIRSEKIRAFINAIMDAVDAGDYKKAYQVYTQNPGLHQIKGFEKELNHLNLLMQKIQQVFGAKRG